MVIPSSLFILRMYCQMYRLVWASRLWWARPRRAHEGMHQPPGDLEPALHASGIFLHPEISFFRQIHKIENLCDSRFATGGVHSIHSAVKVQVLTARKHSVHSRILEDHAYWGSYFLSLFCYIVAPYRASPEVGVIMVVSILIIGSCRLHWLREDQRARPFLCPGRFGYAIISPKFLVSPRMELQHPWWPP